MKTIMILNQEHLGISYIVFDKDLLHLDRKCISYGDDHDELHHLLFDEGEDFVVDLLDDFPHIDGAKVITCNLEN